MKRFTAYLLALTVAAPLAACSETENIAISRIVMGTAVNDQNEITEVQTEFLPADHEFYAHVFLKDFEGKADIVGQWWYAEDGESKIYETPLTVSDDRSVGKFTLSSENDWPAGRYRFIVKHKGKDLGQVRFLVLGEVGEVVEE